MNEPLSIYILAGGKSSRMEQDKATLLYEGKPLIQYVIEAAKKLSPSVFILSSNSHHQVFNLPCIPDIVLNAGAAGGIDAMLHHSSTKKNMVLSCDMPFIDETSMQYLVSLRDNGDIIVPMLHNYPEALFGIYATACVDEWRKAIDEKQFKLSNILKRFNVHYVNGEELLLHNSRLFTNFNSQEDIEKCI